MQNNFERQVQQKMEELSFVPSAPVWQNVEKQIRREKDRRRLLLVLFILLLVGGSSGWWWLQQQDGTSQPNAVGRVQDPAGAPNAPALPGAEKTKPALEKPSITTTPAGGTQQGIIASPSRIKAAPAKGTGFGPTKENVLASGPYFSVRIGKPSIQGSGNNRSKSLEPVPAEQVIASAPPATDSTARPDVAKQETEAIVPTTTADSTSLAKQKKKKAWRAELTGSAGISGLGTIFSPTTEAFSDNAVGMPSTSGPSPLNNRSAASSPQSGFSFSAGLALSRHLGPRLELLAGLEYRYASTRLVVGGRSQGDTVLRNGATVTQFYASPVLQRQRYTNHYHFVSLPLLLRWQLHQRLPLHIEGGLAAQYLVSTNALSWDSRSRIYYSGQDMLNRFQLSAQAALLYELPLGKNRLLVGPQFQYGLRRLERENTASLLYGGLSVRYRLK
jgi:hypothetical protein